jgi:tRNA-dihydrouridine synthase B
MVSARGFLEMDARSEDFPDRLWGVKDEPRPLAVQIWDNDPGRLAAVGARLAGEFQVSVVDINFGCPVRDVSEKAQSGSYLLRDPARVGAIVARVVEACRPAPVTAKIRLGVGREAINAIEVAMAIEAAGGAAVTVHGRTAADGFAGSADWDQIAAIRPHLSEIPLIGNGDLRTPEAVVDAFRRYGVDGAMIGRAGLARPWLFRQTQAALAGEPIPPEPTLSERRDLLLDHFRLVVERFGTHRATILMRRYACSYAQGCYGARQFRTQVGRVATPEEFIEVVERCFPCDRSEESTRE